jgi:GWxTD domain-containing protein
MAYVVAWVLVLNFGWHSVWADEPNMDHPFLVQAINAQNERDYVLAQDLFEQYIETLPDREQGLFLDFTYVGSGKDLKTYARVSESEKEAVKRRFWTRTDPSPLTKVNERLIEHYRRVAYARIYFGQGRFPWDDRGEIYVRFGAPDHISSSGDLQIEMDREVQDARTNFVQRKRLSLQVTPGQPIFPVPSNTRWMYWVYTDLNRGTEFTFVSQFKRSEYKFASMPDGLGVGLTADLMAYQGQMVLNDLVSREPWVYEADFSLLPIDFFYYPATFRGENGQTRLEIYYGLPASEMSRLPVDKKTDRVLLDRGLAIYDSLWVEQYRIHDQLAFNMPSQKQISDNAFIPGMMTFDVKPGSNYLALQVRDVVSGKSQVYQQALFVSDYSGTDALMMSDIELAFWIAPTDKEGEFVKKGLSVVPMASKAFYVNQTAFVFFELYNLKKNEFDQTKYRVEYVFQSLEKGIAPVRALRGLGRVLKLRERSKEVTISYEQTGNARDDVTYVELDLNDVEPGGQKVRVEVTDLLTNQQVRKEILFDIVP